MDARQKVHSVLGRFPMSVDSRSSLYGRPVLGPPFHLYSRSKAPGTGAPFPGPRPPVSALQRAERLQAPELHFQVPDPPFHLYSGPEAPGSRVPPRFPDVAFPFQQFARTRCETKSSLLTVLSPEPGRPEAPGSRAPFPGPRPSVSALQWAREAPGSGASFPGPRPFVSPLQWARGSRPQSFISTARCRVSPHQLARARCETKKSLLLAVLFPEPACQ